MKALQEACADASGGSARLIKSRLSFLKIIHSWLEVHFLSNKHTRRDRMTEVIPTLYYERFRSFGSRQAEGHERGK